MARQATLRRPAIRRIVLGATGLALLVAAGVAPWTVHSGRLPARLAAQLAAAYGLDLAVGGRTTVALLPVPRFKFADASLTDRDGARLVDGAQLRGELRILPLLFGRIEAGEIEIVGGRIAVAHRDGDAPAWRALLGRLERTVTNPDGAPPVLRRFAISRATIELRDGTAGTTDLVRGVDLTVSWPSGRDALSARGSLTWRGQVVTGSVSGLNLAALAGGRPNGSVDATLAGRDGTVSLSGVLTRHDRLAFAGDVTAAAPSLGRAAALLGLGIGRVPLDRPLSLNGEATLTAEGLTVPGARIVLGADRLDGSVALSFGPHPALRATLAATRLDLGWLLDEGAPLIDRWDEARPGSGPGDAIDLRLSAGTLRLGGVSLADAAMAILVDGGRSDLSLMRGQLGRGTVKGRATVTFGPRGDALKGQLAFDGIDLRAVTTDLVGFPAVTGSAQGSLAVETSGGAGPFRRRLDGRGTMTVKAGEIAAVDLARCGGDRAGPAAGRPQRPATRSAAFDLARIPLTLTEGVAELGDAQIDGPGPNLRLEGRVSLPDESVDLRALCPGTAPDGKPRLAFDVVGPWADPRLMSRVETARDHPGEPAVR